MIEAAVVVAILGIVTAVSMPRLNELVTHAAATRDLTNARLIYTSANMLIASGTDLAGSDLKDSTALKSIIGELPASAQWSVDIFDGAVASVTYMTAGSPGGLQTFPN